MDELARVELALRRAMLQAIDVQQILTLFADELVRVRQVPDTNLRDLVEARIATGYKRSAP